MKPKRQIEPRFLDVRDAAAYMGISTKSIRRYLENGDLHSYRPPAPGNNGAYMDKVLIERRELDRLIERGARV